MPTTIKIEQTPDADAFRDLARKHEGVRVAVSGRWWHIYRDVSITIPDEIADQVRPEVESMQRDLGWWQAVK